MMKRLIVLLGYAGLAACTPSYSLVSPAPVRVAKSSFRVQPGLAWNKAPKSGFDIPEEENWTENGPLLDQVGFIGGLPEGKAIVKQRRKADQKVPTFAADMSPQDLVSMIEVQHRIAGATVFETTNVTPRPFLGKTGLQLDYRYVGADEVRRRGRAVLAVVDHKLYVMTLDGAALHYFDAALPDFETMVATAAIA